MRQTSARFSLVIVGLSFLAIAALVFFGQPARAVVPAGAPDTHVLVAQAHPDSSPAGSRPATVTSLDGHDYQIDMGKLGLRPLDHPLQSGKGALGGPSLLMPNGAVVGVGAFMSVSPDVVSQSTTSAIATLSSDWTPGESVQYYLNGSLAITATADTNGRVAVNINTGAGQGYITFRSIGLTSGKSTGGVAQVLDNAPNVPGLAVAPHAINPNGSSNIYMYGVRFPPTSTVTLARNTTVLGTATTNAVGRFLVSVPVAAGADTSAVYNAYTVTVGSMAGQSIEERADAGPPPIGDQNPSRAFVDRAVLNSVTGGTFAIVGEGFQPAESVVVSGCAAGAVPADANGAIGAFLTGGPGAGVYNCTFTGGTSGRVARLSVLASPNATNAPSAISQPAAVSGTGNFAFLYSKLAPSITGTIFIDGVSQGTASTNANGYGSVTLPKPTTPYEHAVTFVGSNGQVAIAPVFVLPGGGPTATTTRTATVTSTPCVAANYTYITSTGTIISGTTDTGNHCDDCSTTITLPFSYMLYDQAFTTAAVGSNGYLSFGTANSTFNPSCIPVTGATYTIAPYWRDQCTGACTGAPCVGCGVFTSVSGSAPNRIFNIEWRTFYYNSPAPLNYEVRLYEGQTHFDVIYGLVTPFTATGRNLSVGVQKNTTQYTLVGCDPTGGTNPPVSTGQLYSYDLTGCGGSTSTPTRTATVVATPTCAPSNLRVLIAYSDVGGPPTTLVSQIQAEPGVTAVDLFDASASTPTLSQLTPYQVVVAFSNNPYADPVAMGDVLANYADAGGVVVGFNFNWYGSPFGLEGRWMTGGYSPFNSPAPSNFSNSSMGVFSATHPLMLGVTTQTGFFRHSVTLAPGAVQVAAWADSIPLVAYKTNNGHTGVGINNYVGENPNQWSGQVGRIVVNAGRWLVGAPCGTATVTPTRTSTALVTNTSTATVSRTSTATSTRTATTVPSSTNTAVATSTNTAVSTNTSTGTVTVVPPTSTHTHTPTTVPSPTCTPIVFSDVNPSDYFYNAVEYLACKGAISGYSDGTFRPYNDTTRGQVSKIVVISEGFPLDTTGGPHFSDVPTSNPFYLFIETAYNRGIISGYADGTFRPFANVTRAQLSKMIVLAEGWAIDTTGGPHFSDVATDNPFYGFIETAYNHGIIAGYSNGTFRPNNNATRGQISVIIYRALTQP